MPTGGGPAGGGRRFSSLDIGWCSSTDGERLGRPRLWATAPIPTPVLTAGNRPSSELDKLVSRYSAKPECSGLAEGENS